MEGGMRGRRGREGEKSDLCGSTHPSLKKKKNTPVDM